VPVNFHSDVVAWVGAYLFHDVQAVIAIACDEGGLENVIHERLLLTLRWVHTLTNLVSSDDTYRLACLHGALEGKKSWADRNDKGIHTGCEDARTLSALL
jgi:hypothetical protein